MNAPNMLKAPGILLIFILTVLTIQGQPTTKFTGEYYLQGVMETASGFKLNEDSTFEFFFIYGALDRYGMGTWLVKNGKLYLNSRSKPDQDFILLNSQQVPGDSTTIKITDNNPILSRYVHGSIKNGKQVNHASADEQGIVKFPGRAADSISLVFEFCPEKLSVFPVTGKKHNYFEFSFGPSLMEVFFDNFVLAITKDGLSGKHPLLTGELYSYQKEEVE